MQFDLAIFRIASYMALALFSFILFCLCAARLNYTNHLPKGDPLNGGRNFYDPVVAELLFTSLVTVPWCIFIAFSIHKRYENRYISTFLAEIVGLAVLWLFWIGGAGAATNLWGNLSWCQQIQACRILSALVAFAWLGWLTLTILLGLSLLFTLANSAMKEPLHGRWNPRQSIYVDKPTGV